VKGFQGGEKIREYVFLNNHGKRIITELISGNGDRGCGEGIATSR